MRFLAGNSISTLERQFFQCADRIYASESQGLKTWMVGSQPRSGSPCGISMPPRGFPQPHLLPVHRPPHGNDDTATAGSSKIMAPASSFLQGSPRAHMAVPRVEPPFGDF